jgi:hypothetical protein
MAFIVEMVHRKEDCPEPRFYSCHRDTWKQLLTLAETFGWQPSGSVNANDIDHPTVDYDKHFKPTYDPDEWAYCKAVSKEDAKNIAQGFELQGNDYLIKSNTSLEAIVTKVKQYLAGYYDHH